jgi:beta-phosphoglucomutase-like phosphatase (HAD superfamily)
VREVTVELRKYPGLPSRNASTRLLGTDEHGTWLVHAEHRIVYLIPDNAWWKARHFPDGGWKVDIATPATWTEDRVVLDDLALDVRKLHGRVWIEDEDEFADHVSAGRYPPDIAAAARAACDAIAASMHEEPFVSTGDRWLAEVPGRWDAALLLDMGGVLARRTTDEATLAWEARLDLPPGGVAAALGDAIGPGWEGGRTVEDIDRIAGEALGVDQATLFDLRVDLTREAQLDGRWLKLIGTLPTTAASAIVSNNGAGVRRLWDAAYDIASIVDLVFISGEERVAKPDRLLYDIVRWRLGVAPERCVFVDDVPTNVEAACAAGMIGLLHTEAEPAYEAAARALAALQSSATG